MRLGEQHPLSAQMRSLASVASTARVGLLSAAPRPPLAAEDPRQQPRGPWKPRPIVSKSPPDCRTGRNSSCLPDLLA